MNLASLWHGTGAVKLPWRFDGARLLPLPPGCRGGGGYPGSGHGPRPFPKRRHGRWSWSWSCWWLMSCHWWPPGHRGPQFLVLAWWAMVLDLGCCERCQPRVRLVASLRIVRVFIALNLPIPSGDRWHRLPAVEILQATSCGFRIPGVPRLDSVSWRHVIGMLGFVVGSDPRTAPTHPSRQWIGLILITVIALHRPACCAVTQRSWELGIVTLCSHRSASGVSPILRGRGGVGMCWCRTAGTPHQMPPLAPHPTLGF